MKDFEKREDAIGGYEPLKTITKTKSRPRTINRGDSKITEDDLFKALSRRRTGESVGSDATENDEQAEIERLMSRMFGRTRQANSAEEKTRHVGVVFKNLTVKGMGLGAALQPTTGDIFMGLPRLIKGLFSKGPKTVGKKENVREILSDFTGCIKPGEMVLVLGRPGSGCSTFLKVLGNQRFGYVAVDGEVTYGGTDAKIMGKDFRGEVRDSVSLLCVILTSPGPVQPRGRSALRHTQRQEYSVLRSQDPNTWQGQSERRRKSQGLRSRIPSSCDKTILDRAHP